MSTLPRGAEEQFGSPNAGAYQSRKGKILAGSRLLEVLLFRGKLSRPEEEAIAMSLTIVFLLVGFWLLGLLNGYAFGGLIHILLVYAGLMVTARLLERRRRRSGQLTAPMEPFEPQKPQKI